MGPIARVFSPDLRLLGPALLLVALTTVLCGAGPALRATRMDLLSGLRRGSAQTTERLHLRHAYAVGQIALSLVLLVGASLCWRSQMRPADADLGFDIEHGIVSRFIVEPTFGSEDARQVFADRVRARAAAIPGVQSAAITGVVPLGGDALVAAFHPAGRSDIPGTRPSTLSVGRSTTRLRSARDD